MKKLSYIIKDELGLHARPAGMLAKKAAEFQSSITISNGTKKVNAKGIFNIMQLAIESNQEIMITIEGEDEELALHELETFLKETM